MGKRPQAAAEFQSYARRFSERIRGAKIAKAASSDPKPTVLEASAEKSSPSVSREGCGMDIGSEGEKRRFPLADVVSDCVSRWFQDALKEARDGDTGMQVLVGQMYRAGYGVPRNDQKAKAWITKASKYRSSAWKVSDKRPGYNASDSDSDEAMDVKVNGQIEV